MRKMTENEAMSLAISEAKKGWGKTSPNPLVGCVILSKEGDVLAKGYHAHYGGAHAEISAMSQIVDRSKLHGALVYVTLEPCAHVGKTGSCATALVDAQVGRVVYGVEDPFEEVKGEGIARLRAAGIVAQRAESENIQQECEELAEIFLCNHRENRAFVALKLAASIDGVVSLNSGESQWITSEESRTHSHYLRAQYDAVLVGRKTVEEDDPFLNVRHPDFEGHRNKVVIIDPQLKCLEKLPERQLFKIREPEEIFIVCSETAPVQDMHGTQRVSMTASNEGHFNWQSLLTSIYERDIRSLFVEGGAHTIGQFLQTAHGVHRFYLYQSASVLGLGGGIGWSQNFAVKSLDQRLYLSSPEVSSLGQDIFISAQIKI